MKSTKDLYEEHVLRKQFEDKGYGSHEWLLDNDKGYAEMRQRENDSWWQNQDADEQRMAERLHTTTGE